METSAGRGSDMTKDAELRIYLRCKNLIETICRAMSATPTSTARSWVEPLREVFEDAELKALACVKGSEPMSERRSGHSTFQGRPLPGAPRGGIMETMILVGSEEVSRAGHNMLRAAEQMANVSGNMQSVLEAHQRFLDDWLARFEVALREAEE